MSNARLVVACTRPRLLCAEFAWSGLYQPVSVPTCTARFHLADVMYVREAVPDLVKSLVSLTKPSNKVNGAQQESSNKNTKGTASNQSTSGGRCSKEPSLETTTVSTILLSHGRNRFAEEEFMTLARQHFTVAELQEQELHPDYQCSDVTVYKLVPLPPHDCQPKPAQS